MSVPFIAGVFPEIQAGYIVEVPELFRKAYLGAAGLVHPDRTGGDDTQFKRLQAAKEVLERHHAPR